MLKQNFVWKVNNNLFSSHTEVISLYIKWTSGVGVFMCILPSACILWSSESGIINSSRLLLLYCWVMTADGLKTWLLLSWESFCQFKYTTKREKSAGKNNNHKVIYFSCVVMHTLKKSFILYVYMDKSNLNKWPIKVKIFM